MTLKSNTMRVYAPITKEQAEFSRLASTGLDDTRNIKRYCADCEQLVSEILGRLEQRYSNIDITLDLDDPNEQDEPGPWFAIASDTSLSVLDLLCEGFSSNLTKGGSRLKIATVLEKDQLKIEFCAIHGEIKLPNDSRIRQEIEAKGGKFSVETTLAGIDLIRLSFSNSNADANSNGSAGEQRSIQKQNPLRDGTILLIEDDQALRTLTELVLTRGGYKVISAETSDQALELYKLNHRMIDAVMTDVNLAGESGLMLAEKLWFQSPKLQILFTSGDPHAIGKIKSIKQRSIAYLEKPYRMRELIPFIESVFTLPE